MSNDSFNEKFNLLISFLDEFEEFQEANPAVNDTIRDFLHSTLHNSPMAHIELHPSDTNFSPVQRLQIRNRASSLARHFCNDDPSFQQMEQRLSILFRSFGLDEREASMALQENMNMRKNIL